MNQVRLVAQVAEAGFPCLMVSVSAEADGSPLNGLTKDNFDILLFQMSGPGGYLSQGLAVTSCNLLRDGRAGGLYYLETTNPFSDSLPAGEYVMAVTVVDPSDGDRQVGQTLAGVTTKTPFVKT
jgi:hypothetical protein